MRTTVAPSSSVLDRFDRGWGGFAKVALVKLGKAWLAFSYNPPSLISQPKISMNLVRRVCLMGSPTLT
jgi:hypothetical protein